MFGTNERVEGLLDQSITRHFMTNLTDQNDKICAEYVWIGGSGWDLRSKSRTLDKKDYKPQVGCCIRRLAVTLLPACASPGHASK